MKKISTRLDEQIELAQKGLEEWPDWMKKLDSFSKKHEPESAKKERQTSQPEPAKKK